MPSSVPNNNNDVFYTQFGIKTGNSEPSLNVW